MPPFCILALTIVVGNTAITALRTNKRRDHERRRQLTFVRGGQRR